MMEAGAFFVAQRFAMRDKDVLYFGNAAANQPAKMTQLISQMFSPIMTGVAAINAVN
jgi:polysaccharide export outer membrane protein